MKILKIVFTVLLAGVFLPLQSQNWQSAGGGTSMFVRGFYSDTVNKLLYVVGNFPYAGDSLVYQIATWNGSNWGKVGNGSGDTNCHYGCNPIVNVIKFNNDIFTCGSNWMMGGEFENKFLSRWDGTQWNSCGKPNEPPSGFRLINNELFVIGGFDTISNIPAKRIAKWNGTDWESFGVPFPLFPFGDVFNIGTAAYYKGEYYFAGNFDYEEIMRWDGAQWNSIANGVLGDAWINNIVVFKNTLFVGGNFYQSDGNAADFLMAWDGQHWFDPFPDIQFINQVKDLEVIDNKLYITGGYIIPSANDSFMYAFAVYDGSYFSPFGGKGLYPYMPAIPWNIAGLNGNIYVSCTTELMGDSVKYIAQWIGTSYDTTLYIPLGISAFPDMEYRISVYPNPFTNFTTLQTTKPLQKAALSIYDILGKEVKSFHNLNGTEIKISGDGMKSGMYFFTLVDVKGFVGKGKMIVE